LTALPVKGLIISAEGSAYACNRPSPGVYLPVCEQGCAKSAIHINFDVTLRDDGLYCIESSLSFTRFRSCRDVFYFGMEGSEAFDAEKKDVETLVARYFYCIISKIIT